MVELNMWYYDLISRYVLLLGFPLVLLFWATKRRKVLVVSIVGCCNTLLYFGISKTRGHQDMKSHIQEILHCWRWLTNCGRQYFVLLGLPPWATKTRILGAIIHYISEKWVSIVAPGTLSFVNCEGFLTDVKEKGFPNVVVVSFVAIALAIAWHGLFVVSSFFLWYAALGLIRCIDAPLGLIPLLRELCFLVVDEINLFLLISLTLERY